MAVAQFDRDPPAKNAGPRDPPPIGHDAKLGRSHDLDARLGAQVRNPAGRGADRKAAARQALLAAAGFGVFHQPDRHPPRCQEPAVGGIDGVVNRPLEDHLAAMLVQESPAVPPPGRCGGQTQTARTGPRRHDAARARAAPRN